MSKKTHDLFAAFAAEHSLDLTLASEKDETLRYANSATQLLWESWSRSAAAAREHAAASLELSSQAIRLMAGEMTAQEMRTVKAVLTNRAAVVRRGD